MYIQFGDAYNPEMAYYSGQFHHQGFGWGDRKGNRVFYVDETETLQLAYCNTESAWTISWKIASSPCEFLFKSQETETFDVVDVGGGSWSVKTDIGDVPVDWLKLFCNDCNDEICKPENGKCVRDDSKGSKVNKCQCHNNNIENQNKTVGLNCDIQVTCHYQKIDKTTTDLLSVIPGASYFINSEFWSVDSLILQMNITFDDNFDVDTMLMHNRPIYLSYTDNPGFMIFTGRRWVLFSSEILDVSEGLSSVYAEKFRNDFITFLHHNDPANKPFETLKNISLTFTNHTPLFFSMPVNYGGEFYQKEFGIPWVQAAELENYAILSARPDDGQPLGVRYLCSDCVSYVSWFCSCLCKHSMAFWHHS